MLRLTNSEKELMDIFWNAQQPITSIDIAKMDVKKTWSKNYIQNMIRSLLKKNALAECGTTKYNTQYARLFVPAITKEELAAHLALSTGIKDSSIPKVVTAMVEKNNEGDPGAVREQLKEIIDELKNLI